MDDKEFKRRADAFKPRVISTNPSHMRRKIASEGLPKGATLNLPMPISRRQGTFNPDAMQNFSGSGGQGQTLSHMQRPYLPEIESPDRMQYPIVRQEANYYWRLFHKFDPIFGTAMDMYSEMLVSDFDLDVKETKDSDINDTVMFMCEKTQFQERFRQMIVQYMVIGDVVPHTYFDEDLGIWTYIALHNPDYIDIKDSPIINMEPIINFVPDSNLIGIMSDRSPESMELKRNLPSEFVSRILAGQPIRLKSSNCSYIARKLNPYDERGTSIASRLWRIWMVEDAVYASTIATYRRNASPIKVLKLGDAATGWIPDPSTEVDLLSMLNRCETDPSSWLIYHYGIQFEAWGTTERAINIKSENDTIEKIKLVALGLSKGFMTGEVSFACQFEDAKMGMSDGSYKDIKDVKVGDEVRDIYGDEKQVTDILKYESPDEMTKITTYGSRVFHFTNNHELPVFSRPHRCLCGCDEDLGDEKITSNGYRIWKSFSAQHHKNDGKSGRGRNWIEYKNNERVVVRFPEEHNPYQRLQAEDVRIGDWLTIPRHFKVSGPVTNKENIAKARLLGYYVAEGSVTESSTTNRNLFTRFSFGKINSEKETQYVGDVKELLNTLGCEPSINTNHNNNSCYTIYIPAEHRDITLWLYNNGNRYSNHKTLSSEVMHWCLELKEELIKGMYRGDGYLHVKDDRSDNINRTTLGVRYTTTSENLVMQLELILAQLGYACLIAECEERIDKNGGKHNKLWFVDVNGKQAYSLAKLIWGDVPSVWDKHNFSNFNKEQHHGENVQIIVDKDYIYLPVVGVEKIKTDKEKHPYVYSLTVEGSHSYTTSNISSFNSVKGGLQVLLRRLASLRQFWESMWIYPKFFRPISLANDWIKSKPNEVNHNYRVKRTAQELEDQKLIIIPEIKWKNKLDPTIDSDILGAYAQMKNFNVKVSRSSVGGVASLDWKNELKKDVEEWKESRELVYNMLGNDLATKYFEEQAGATGKPAGGPGAGAKPPSASGKPPTKPGGAGAKPKPSGGGAPGSGAAGAPETIESPDEGDLGVGID